MDIYKVEIKASDYPAKVHQVFYESKKWWKFWKKKKQIGYLVRWQ